MAVQTQPVPKLCSLQPISHDELENIMLSGNFKSSILDPIPTSLLKKCIETIVPLIATIVNKSIETYTFPDSLKLAAVTPGLKKPSLDSENLGDYRPVSNFPYIGKII